MAVFKAYDIRGIYPTEIDEMFALDLGKAFGTFRRGRIVVGRDVRLSSPALHKKLVEGLLSTGCDVVDLGVVTTPMVIFATAFWGFDAGIAVTASHNPKEYNGFLFYGERGLPIGLHNGLGEVKDIFELKQFRSSGPGNYYVKDIFSYYAQFILSKFSQPVKKFRAVVDCGNGAASLIYPKILRKAGYEIIELNCKPDGNFPDRDPDPSKEENLAGLMSKVVEAKADFGVAYDADGDRLILVDEKGSFVPTRKTFYLLARHAISKTKAPKIVHDALTSESILDMIRQAGGEPVFCKVGHTFVQEKVVAEGAALGGELSGHYFFRDVFGADDVLFATLSVLDFLGQNNICPSEFFGKIPDYPYEALRINTREEEKFKFIDGLIENFRGRNLSINTQDGVRVALETGWALFRASNTEPKISIAYEARDQLGFEKIKGFVDEVISKIPK